MRFCKKCLTFKNESEFYKSANVKDGLSNSCNVCARKYQKGRWDKGLRSRPSEEQKKRYAAAARERREQWTEQRRTHDRIYGVMYRHGITHETKLSMMKEQNGLCAICHSDITNFSHIDHNHETKKIRGLLCFRCNTGLGHFRDSQELLQKAIYYLADRNCISCLHPTKNADKNVVTLEKAAL